MTLEQALDVLSILYSSGDPIIYKGTEVAVDDIWELPDAELVMPAKSVNVDFWSGNDLKRGTFFSLVVDRMLVEQEPGQ
jgi:hypothetical protein